MAGESLPSLAFAFARYIQRESRRRCFPRTHHQAARRRHGLGVTSGPRCCFFARNHREKRRRGYAQRGNHPLRGQAPMVHRVGSSAPTPAANEDIPAIHQAGPSAPAVTDDYIVPATPPSAFNIPPMDWLLAGPSASFLGEEEMFLHELAPPPLPSYCMQHEFGPCPTRTGAPPRLPSLTPSDELSEHLFPPGYGPVSDLPSSTPAAAETSGYPVVPDLNGAIKMEEEGEGQGSSSAPPPPSLATPPPPPAPPLPPTPPPEARRILRQFAAAMAQNHAAVRGAWLPAALGLTGGPGASSSGGGRAAARGTPRLP
ncbi:hypothetical protein ZWY2020_003699 [Hordeum vulgare]|nr:hypothetical protein ZWY2020_003699 [Hordeum vulgare]